MKQIKSKKEEKKQKHRNSPPQFRFFFGEYGWESNDSGSWFKGSRSICLCKSRIESRSMQNINLAYLRVCVCVAKYPNASPEKKVRGWLAGGSLTRSNEIMFDTRDTLKIYILVLNIHWKIESVDSFFGRFQPRKKGESLENCVFGFCGAND